MRSFLLACFLLFLYPAAAQNLDAVILDGLYRGSFESVMEDLSREHGFRLHYEKELVADCFVEDRPMKKPLSLFLTQLCKECKLKWYQRDSTVFIISRYADENTSVITSRAPVAKKEADPAYPGETGTRRRDALPSKRNFTLTGLVRDRYNGEAIPYALVGLRGSGSGTITNADGMFTLVNVPSDTSSLEVRYIGYESLTVYLTPEITAKNLVIEISPLRQEIEEVTVRAEKKQDLMEANGQLSTIRITPALLKKLPSLGVSDMFRTFQLLPGISAANEASSGLYVRGGTPDQNLVLFDGFTVYHVDHLFGFFSAFNANAIKDIQLYKGGFESRFGGRLSSVTEVTGKDGNARQFNLGGDLSLLGFNVFAEIPVGDKFTSLVAYRRSFKTPVYMKLLEQFAKTDGGGSTGGGPAPAPGGGGNVALGAGPAQNESTAKTFFYDLNAKMTWKPDKRNVFSYSLFHSGDMLDNSMQLDDPTGGSSFSADITDITRYGNTGMSGKWTRSFSDRFFVTSLLSCSRFYSNRDNTHEVTITDSAGKEREDRLGIIEDNELSDYSVKSELTWNARKYLSFQTGLYATNYDIRYTYRQDDTNTILARDDGGYLAGGYLQSRIDFLKGRFFIVPGVRLTWYAPTGRLYTEPRWSATYQLATNIRLTGSTGRYYQFANRILREDIMNGSREFWILSDGKTVPVSRADHYIAGVHFDYGRYFFSLEGYHKELSGISEYSLRFKPTLNGIQYDEHFYTGTGRARGIELMVQKKTGSLTGWISYTLAKAENRFEVYGEGYFPANQDIRNEVKLVSMYRYRRWFASAVWVYATGRPYTAPDGGYRLDLPGASGTQSFIDAGEKNAARLPDYHRLDLSIGYTIIQPDTRQELGALTLSCFNAYNRKNIWYKEYEVRNGSMIETSKLFLGLTPNLSLSFNLR